MYKNVSARDKRIFTLTSIAFLLLCVIIGSACFWYYMHLQHTVKSESNDYIAEIASQMGTNVSKTMTDNVSMLASVASLFELSQINSFDEMRELSKAQQAVWHYKKLMLIDKNGHAYDENGLTFALDSDAYLQKVILDKEQSLSTSQVIDGTECIVCASPLENVSIDGKNMVAIAAAYELTSFDKMISMTAFGGKSYAHIIATDGTMIVPSSSSEAKITGYNIINVLEAAKIKSGNSIAKIRSDISEGKGGQTEFVLNDSHEYMTYTPLINTQWSLLTFVPVALVNSQSNSLLSITVLMCIIITAGFTLLIFYLLISTYRNRRDLEKIAYVDAVTGGNTIQKFYELASKALSTTKQTYALVFTNIDKFKLLNEQYGKATCDAMLKTFENNVSSNLAGNECIGRHAADNFCVITDYTCEAELAVRIGKWYEGCSTPSKNTNVPWLPINMQFGVFIINDTTIPIPSMIDRAKLALTGTTTEINSHVHYSLFDESVRQSLLREKKLEDLMEAALANGEFHVFLQPKYLTAPETIGGAEALVRWISTSDGIIYPDEFIPLFEKNSFIIRLDIEVFTQVCATLARWLSEGKTPMKISVNCSRMHLKDAHFISKYTKIADEYKIPHELLEIELTENLVFEDVAYLCEIISDIHKAGFGCSMDDFGSGYSSLNLIQDIPVDTLKLDKVFFHDASAEHQQRTESIVGSIIAMSKALSIKTVAEGIETRSQVEMLKRLNCDFIQGYFYSKPIPIDQFETLAFGAK